jgi:hypothetical protein
VRAEVLEKEEPTDVSFSGLEILNHSRIYDLRRWHPDEESPKRRGHIYVRDRVTLKFLETYEGDRHITLAAPIGVEKVEFRQPNPQLQGTITRIAEPVQQRGRKLTVYEFEYDLSRFLPEEPATIEIEIIGTVPKTVRAPFITHTTTNLISAWILFPADRPYRTYRLVSYPVDMSEPPEIMDNRYAIDHPYGMLIGWSVVNPEENRVYECQWTTE